MLCRATACRGPAPAQHPQGAVRPRYVELFRVGVHGASWRSGVNRTWPSLRRHCWPRGPATGVGRDCVVATASLGWKPSGKNKLGWSLVPNFADVDSAESMRIAADVLDDLAVARDIISDVPKDPGGPLDRRSAIIWAGCCSAKTGAGLADRAGCGHHPVRPVRAPVRGGRARGANPQLRVTIGTDYLIRPDVTVSLARVRTASGLPCCTRGVVQVDDPLRPGAEHPARVPADDPAPPGPAAAPGHGHRRAAADPAGVHRRGTGEVDAACHHIAYDAMAASVAGTANSEQADAWHEVTGQRRVLSYELLAGTLASW